MNKSGFVEKMRSLFSNEKFNLYWTFSILLIVFYVQSDAMLFNLNSKMRIVEFAILFVVLAFCLIRCVFLKIKLFNFKNYFFKRTLFLVGLFLISFLFNLTNTFNIHRYFIQIFNIGLSYIILCSLDVQLMKKHFIYIITVFAFLSLITFSIYKLNENVLSFFPVVTNSAGFKFNFTGFSFLQIRTESGITRRNFGIFREPGVYGVFLIFALVILLFDNLKYKYKYFKIISIIIVLLTIYTTYSTTTIIAAIGVLMTKFFTVKCPLAVKILRFILLAACIAFAVVVVFFPEELKKSEVLFKIFGKFNFKNGSFSSRYFDTISTLCAFLANPLFGVGFGGLHTHIEAIASAFNAPTNGGINSILQVFAVHGIIFGFLIYYALFECLSSIAKTESYFFFFLIFSFFICLFNEDLCNSLFFFLIALSGLSQKELILFGKSSAKEVHTNVPSET